MIYLKKFDAIDEYNQFKNSDEYIEPNVSSINTETTEKIVKYSKKNQIYIELHDSDFRKRTKLVYSYPYYESGDAISQRRCLCINSDIQIIGGKTYEITVDCNLSTAYFSLLIYTAKVKSWMESHQYITFPNYIIDTYWIFSGEPYRRYIPEFRTGTSEDERIVGAMVNMKANQADNIAFPTNFYINSVKIRSI